MSVAPGHSFNSGAGLLTASGLPSITSTTKIAFNECTFGFVPHAGSSYYASRLPGDFGTFLALTGMPITGQDALDLQIADSHIQIPRTYEHEVADILYSMDPVSMTNARFAREAEGSGIHEHKQVAETNQYEQQQILNQQGSYINEIRNRRRDFLHDE